MDELKLEIKNISKGFGEIYNREDILEDFDLKVMSVEVLVLVSLLGCGKYTFVNLIAGF
jgi:ABC-type sugar transport systems, ATPase components